MEANTTTTLTASGLLALFVSGLVAVLVKGIGDNQLEIAKSQLRSDSDARLEQVKSENATRLEQAKSELRIEGDQRLVELKADLDKTLAEAATQFSWVYQRQAQATVDLYALLVKLEAACKEQQRVLTYGKETDLAQATAGQDRLIKALTDFQDFYPPASINFEDNVLEKTQAIDRRFSGLDSLEPFNYQDLSDSIRHLRKELQELLGGPLRHN